MIAVDLLKKLDSIRGAIRNDDVFKRNPRAILPVEWADQFRVLVEEIESGEGPKTVTLELDAEGRPIIPNSLQDIFATVPDAPILAPSEGAKVIRRNPVLPATPAQKADAAAPSATTANVLPRETLHVNRPPDLQDATEDTVGK